MVPLRPLGTRLPAGQSELVFACTDDFFNLGGELEQTAHFGGRQCQAIGGVVLGAVSDDQDFPATRPPAGLRPVGMTPTGPPGLTVEPAVLLQPADEIPSIVANPFQERLDGYQASKST
jgi:hypothetical protein